MAKALENEEGAFDERIGSRQIGVIPKERPLKGRSADKATGQDDTETAEPGLSEELFQVLPYCSSSSRAVSRRIRPVHISSWVERFDQLTRLKVDWRESANV